MKLKWRNLPAIITFLAGFITCVITIVYKYPLNKMLWVLILVMTVFYIIGLSIRAVIMRFVETKDDDEDGGETAEDGKDGDGDGQEEEQPDEQEIRDGQPVNE